MENVVLKYIVEEATTVRDILINKLKISSRLLRKLKLNKRIFCNGKEAWVNDKVNVSDEITVNISFEERNDKIIAEEGKLDILYEDNCLLIINKPHGVVVHPTCIHQSETLANYVKFYLEKRQEFITTRFVNRLDRETSGVIVFAKNDYTQEILSRQMQDNTFYKEYIAIVHGILTNKKGTIDMPIKRAPNSIMERMVADDGEKAITYYEVIKELEDMSVVKIRLETGRTHQIRVHFKAIGHPLLGDGLYSDIKTNLIDRQALHALKVSFYHPITKLPFYIEAKIPEDMNKIINIEV